MTYRIQIEGGDGFSVSADEDTLLRGALRAGVGFPHECNVGGCGGCRFDLIEGKMETLWDGAPGLSERDRRRGKRLACQSKPRGDCVVRVRCADEYKPAIAPRRFEAKLTGKQKLTGDMSLFTFRADGAADFLPGQYALLFPPQTNGPRAYSMSNLANGEGVWRFIIRRTPNGVGSNALFDKVAVGDTLAIDGPYGHAYLRADSPREIVCVAGGSGVGPMLSVAQGALAQADTPRLHFFDGARTQSDLCAGAFFNRLAAPPDRLAYRPVLSAAATTDDWTGSRGFVHEEVERVLPAPLDRYEFYFAGPPPMIEALQNLLMVRARVPYQQIHFDRFL